MSQGESEDKFGVKLAIVVVLAAVLTLSSISVIRFVTSGTIGPQGPVGLYTSLGGLAFLLGVYLQENRYVSAREAVIHPAIFGVLTFLIIGSAIEGVFILSSFPPASFIFASLTGGTVATGIGYWATVEYIESN